MHKLHNSCIVYCLRKFIIDLGKTCLSWLVPCLSILACLSTWVRRACLGLSPLKKCMSTIPTQQVIYRCGRRNLPQSEIASKIIYSIYRKSIIPMKSNLDIGILCYSAAISIILFFALMLTYAGDGAGVDGIGFNLSTLFIYLIFAFPAYSIFMLRLFQAATRDQNFRRIVIPGFSSLMIFIFVFSHYYLMIFILGALKIARNIL